MLLSAFLLITFAYVPTHPSVLLVVPFISAACGGFIIASAAIYSFLGDYSSPATLAIDIAIYEGVLGLSANIGSIIGGVLYGLYGFPCPMMLYAGLLVATILYTATAIRDRRVLAREFHQSTFKRLFTTKNIKENKEMLTKERLGNTRRHIILLLLCSVIGLACATGMGTPKENCDKNSKLVHS